MRRLKVEETPSRDESGLRPLVTFERNLEKKLKAQLAGFSQ